MQPNPNHARPVLHIVYGLDFGGVESHMRTIAETHGRYRHAFCAISWGGVTCEAIREAGRDVSVLHQDAWKRPLSTIYALIRFLRRLRPQVVHTHGAEANLFGLPAAWMAGVPGRIGEEIGMPKHSLKASIAMKTVFFAAQRVIGVAEAVRTLLVESGEVPEAKAVRIYNPVSIPDVRTARRRDGDPLRIAFVGRLHAEKNPLGLLEALALLLEEGLPLEARLVGDGPQRDDIQAFIEQHGITESVSLLGFRTEPFEQLADCHLYVQPSLSEGLSLALVEALGCGLPAVSSVVGGSPEVITHGLNGWILPSPNPGDIAAAIAQACALPADELARMSDRAMQSVRDRFDPDTYMRNVEALYDQVLSRP